LSETSESYRLKGSSLALSASEKRDLVEFLKSL
jgi:hypothetical protein